MKTQNSISSSQLALYYLQSMPESIKAREMRSPVNDSPQTSEALLIASTMQQSEQMAEDLAMLRPTISHKRSISHLRTMQSSQKTSLANWLFKLAKHLPLRIMNWRAELAMIVTPWSKTWIAPKI